MQEIKKTSGTTCAAVISRTNIRRDGTCRHPEGCIQVIVYSCLDLETKEKRRKRRKKEKRKEKKRYPLKLQGPI